MIRFYKKVTDFNWKYALGEVSLIFVGITLAIWFNNWNQRRIDTSKKIEYLSNLISDLNSDIAEYDELIDANAMRMKRINLLGSLLTNPSNVEVNCDSVQTYLASASFINVFIGASTVFDDLENTGNLILIDNSTLKQKLMQYYAKVDSRKHYEDLNSRFHINTIGPFLKSHWNTGALFRLGMGTKTLYNNLAQNDCQATIQKMTSFREDAQLNQELMNQINFSFIIINMNNEEYKDMKQMAEELIAKIERE